MNGFLINQLFIKEKNTNNVDTIGYLLIIVVCNVFFILIFDIG